MREISGLYYSLLHILFSLVEPTWVILPVPIQSSLYTGEEVSIDKQVACEECPRWLKMTEVAWEEISYKYIFYILMIEIGSFHGY